MKVVKGFFSNKYWVENKNGKRVTYKSFCDYLLMDEGKFYIVAKEASNAIWIFRKDTEELLYHGLANVYNNCNLLFNKYFAQPLISCPKTLIIDEHYNVKFMPYITCPDAGFGMAIIREEDKFSYIKEDFSLAIDAKYNLAGSFNQYGYAFVKTTDNVQQIIDIHGNVVIDNAEYALTFLNEKYIKTYSEENYGLIDINGNRILPDFFSHISFLNENYFLIEKKGKKGIADLSGKIILEPIYDEIMETEHKYIVRDFAKIEIDKTKSVTK